TPIGSREHVSEARLRPHTPTRRAVREHGGARLPTPAPARHRGHLPVLRPGPPKRVRCDDSLRATPPARTASARDRAAEADQPKALRRPAGGWRPMRILRAGAALTCLVAFSAPAGKRSVLAAEHADADPTITFRGRSASVGVGLAWGASTVEFQGKTYPVRADGFVLGGLGSASIEGVGKIFGLTKIEDLNGDYTAEGQPQFQA